jgi:hypothetical protein
VPIGQKQAGSYTPSNGKRWTAALGRRRTIRIFYKLTPNSPPNTLVICGRFEQQKSPKTDLHTRSVTCNIAAIAVFRATSSSGYSPPSSLIVWTFFMRE